MNKFNFKQAILDIMDSEYNEWDKLEKIEGVIIKILKRSIKDKNLILRIISDMSGTPK